MMADKKTIEKPPPVDKEHAATLKASREQAEAERKRLDAQRARGGFCPAAPAGGE